MSVVISDGEARAFAEYLEAKASSLEVVLGEGELSPEGDDQVKALAIRLRLRASSLREQAG